MIPSTLPPDPADTPATLLDSWTLALTQAGWQQRAPTLSVHRAEQAQVRELTDPTGLLAVHVTWHSPQEIRNTELWSTPPTGAGHPDWRVRSAVLPASVILAAAQAAGNEPGPTVADRLEATGWYLAAQDYDEDGHLFERSFTTCDRTGWVILTAPDPGADHDNGSWSITRPGALRGPTPIHASPQTPAAVITALALAP